MSPARSVRKPTLRFHNSYQTTSPRPTGSTSPNFMQIPNAKLRRSIVNLVEQLADSEDQ